MFRPLWPDIATELICDRSLRIRWAAIGLTACVLSITAIELTLKWNKVVGVYSIASTGQYISLIIGSTSFVSVCWSLIKQESVSGHIHRD